MIVEDKALSVEDIIKDLLDRHKQDIKFRYADKIAKWQQKIAANSNDPMSVVSEMKQELSDHIDVCMTALNDCAVRNKNGSDSIAPIFRAILLDEYYRFWNRKICEDEGRVGYANKARAIEKYTWQAISEGKNIKFASLDGQCIPESVPDTDTAIEMYLKKTRKN